MSKVISLNSTREKIKKGIDLVADAVKITIGPRGKNVMLEGGVIANDGGTIVKQISLKDPFENMGAQLVKSVIAKTSEDVGGGRTASAILTQAIITEGMKLIDKGVNTTLLKKGMDQAVKDICEKLDEMARPVKGVEELKKVATISTENEELGTVIAETIHKIGKDGVVTVEEGQSLGISTEIVEGLKFDKGYVSPYMATNERMEAEFKNAPVMITDKKVFSYKEFFPVIEKLMKEGKNSLVLIAEDIEGEALNNFVINKLRGAFNVLAIKTPGFGDIKKYVYEDLCEATGAQLVSDSTGITYETAKFGSAKKIISTKTNTTIIGGAGDLKTWVATLKTRMELSENKWEKDQYVERIAKLSNGMAVIKVGASSEAEIKYLKLKIEDGVNETKRALEEGIIVGGDVAYLNAVKTVANNSLSVGEEGLGYDLILNAVQAPLRQIVINSNDKPDVIVNEIISSDSLTLGYNSLDNKVIPDMYKAGIIDAVKVTKTVLQNAVSASALFLSVEVAIVEEKEDK